MIEVHKTSKAFAKRLKKVLEINQAVNFPPVLKEAILKMHLCTKDLAIEKEIAHYEEPKGIRNDGMAKQISNLTKDRRSLQGKNKAQRKGTDRSRSRTPFTKKVRFRGSRANQQGQARNQGGQARGKGTRCDYCHKMGHVQASCFQLHPDLRLKGKAANKKYRAATNTRNKQVFKPGFKLSSNTKFNSRNKFRNNKYKQNPRSRSASKSNRGSSMRDQNSHPSMQSHARLRTPLRHGLDTSSGGDV